MSYQDKLDRASALVQEHNEALQPGSATSETKPKGYIDPSEFISCLKLSGATNEERLASLSYEDIAKCMPSMIFKNGVGLGQEVKPIALAKDIAKVFRSGKAESTSDDKRPISGKKADRMTPRELVDAFDPEDSDSPVAKRLKDISKGQAFIVFTKGRVVNADKTLELLLEVKQGFPGRDTVEVEGDIKRVHSIGELPDNYADENPIYNGRPLRPDGTCDQTNRSWAGVPDDVRQLVRIALEIGEIKISGIDSAHNVLDFAVQPDAFKKLRQRYHRAAVEFDERKQRGTLPRLEVPLGDGGRPGNSPFDGGKQVVWYRETSGNFNARQAYVRGTKSSDIARH